MQKNNHFNKIHSDAEIQHVLSIRASLKDKGEIAIISPDDKEQFIKHYNTLFINGASEFPGILEFYSVLKTKRGKPSLGAGCFFKMSPEDAMFFGYDIVKYFLVHNADVFPLAARAKLAIDAYVELLDFSNVKSNIVKQTKEIYYTKYNWYE